jgi:crossover junction endodeoxyribonuclease RusA
MTEPITFLVPGIPQPQGSARAFMPKGSGSFPIVTSDNPKLYAWRRNVSKVARLASRGRVLLEGPIRVSVAFHLPAPKSLRTVTPHVTRPDCDKLVRGILDALTGVIFKDDGQVTEIGARKQYTEAGQPPRAVITVTSLHERRN